MLREENALLRKSTQELELKFEELFPCSPVHSLTKEQINRYGRHLIMDGIGTSGQKKLLLSSVLIVGAGGLGSPCSLYLSAAGIGRIGIVDHDVVEISNLHRQIIHQQASIGIPKSISAKQTIQRLNPTVDCISYVELLSGKNALEIIRPYDLVVDATDNVSTRYLLNDACVLLNKPLVSGAALRTDGQITVYHYRGGPCYRCLFPNPPPPETVTDCSNGGVLGVVPGIIGCLQALEAIKIIIGIGDVLSGKLLLFDALAERFQSVKLRDRNKNCEVCGDNPSILEPIDYEVFCKSKATDKPSTRKLLQEDSCISCMEYRDVLLRKQKHLLLDVRDSLQYEICSLSNAWNIPLRILPEQLEEVKKKIRSQCNDIEKKDELPVYVMCRRGNDSQLAVQLLRSHGISSAKNINGGLLTWAKEVDPRMPIY